MFNFKIDEKSDALSILNTLAKLPMASIHKSLAKTARTLVKESYGARWKRTSGSMYQYMKRALLSTNNPVPGMLTGATKAGIKHSGDERSGEVFLKGEWPPPGFDAKIFISLSAMDNMTENTMASTSPWGRVGLSEGLMGAGATVSLKSGEGLRIIWDKSLQNSFKDVFIKATKLENKQYGEMRLEAEGFSPSRRFMFLSQKQEDIIVEKLGEEIDKILYGKAVKPTPIEKEQDNELARLIRAQKKDLNPPKLFHEGKEWELEQEGGHMGFEDNPEFEPFQGESPTESPKLRARREKKLGHPRTAYDDMQRRGDLSGQGEPGEDLLRKSQRLRNQLGSGGIDDSFNELTKKRKPRRK